MIAAKFGEVTGLAALAMNLEGSPEDRLRSL